MKHFSPTINADKLKSTQKYVCWLDIMGTQNTMSESMAKSANFILKLHACVKNSIAVADAHKVTLYPVMDGVYMTFKDKKILTKSLKNIFSTLSYLFLSENDDSKRFIVRASLAYGDIIEGHDLEEAVTPDLDLSYRSNLLLGLPVIQAFRSEKLAPPFGIYIHESARKYDDDYRLQGSTFQWWSKDQDMSQMNVAINEYFSFCEFNRALLNMESSKINDYNLKSQAYFTKYKPSKNEEIEK